MKIKVVSIDVDGCLISYEGIGSNFKSSWDAVGYSLGLKEKWDWRIKKYYGKPNDDYEWCRQDAEDLKGKMISEVEKVIYPLPYSSGVKDFVEKTKGILILGLLTSGLDLVAVKAKEELGLDFCYCNILYKDNGFFTGKLGYNVPNHEKHKKISDICERYNCKPEEICHVGDHENDIPCFERVGLGVAFNPKTESAKLAAKYTIFDFRELNKILL